VNYRNWVIFRMFPVGFESMAKYFLI